MQSDTLRPSASDIYPNEKIPKRPELSRNNARTDGRGADQVVARRAYDIYSRLLKEHIIFIGDAD